MTQTEHFRDVNLPGTRKENSFFGGLPGRTVSPVVRRRGWLASRAVRLLRLIDPTFGCVHANTSFPRVYEQKCLDCGKVRLLGCGHEAWHREVI